MKRIVLVLLCYEVVNYLQEHWNKQTVSSCHVNHSTRLASCNKNIKNCPFKIVIHAHAHLLHWISRCTKRPQLCSKIRNWKVIYPIWHMIFLTCGTKCNAGSIRAVFFFFFKSPRWNIAPMDLSLFLNSSNSKQFTIASWSLNKIAINYRGFLSSAYKMSN